MKKWKRFAAWVLMAAMVMMLLTACGGGGSSAPSVTPDTSREKQMIEYVQNYVRNYCNAELAEENGEIRDALYSVLPQAVSCINGKIEGNDTSGQMDRLVNTLDQKMRTQNRKGFFFTDGFVGFLTESGVNEWLSENQMDLYIGELRRLGVEPKHISVAATTQFNSTVGMDVVYIVLTIMD